MQVLLERKMKLVALLQIYWDCLAVNHAHLMCCFEPTLEDLTKLLNGPQPSTLHTAALVLVAAEPAPEENAFALERCQY